MPSKKYRHIFVQKAPDVSRFRNPQSGRDDRNFLPRQRDIHSAYLTAQLNRAWQQVDAERSAVMHVDRQGAYIEFKSDPGYDLTFKSLEHIGSGIRLLNVREEASENKLTTYATIYVPNNKKDYFFKKIQEYATKNTFKKGLPQHLQLMESIADIKKAYLESFWQGAKERMPSQEKKEWCEIWLSGDKPEIVERFESLLTNEEIETARGVIVFPERSVKLILASRAQLERLILVSDDIAEIRRATETADFWLEMGGREQADWVKDLVGRLKTNVSPNVSICILDHGVNNGHALLKPILQDKDCQTVEDTWGTHDHHDEGHGTRMAGVAGYGDLRQHLQSTKPVTIEHCLESVKILPKPPAQNKQELWGFRVDQAVSLAVIENPTRKRIVCMAIAVEETRDRGFPSSWSGALDAIAAGVGTHPKHLFVVCAGNVSGDLQVAAKYPESQLTNEIHDPGQAWNLLTVGAYTELTKINSQAFAKHTALAEAGGLSPYSTTSRCWDNRWPIKPEIVFEGGNLACDEQGNASDCEDLSLLTTSSKPFAHQFSHFCMTSAATAQAAWFAAQIQHLYPDYWPETIRGLLVHSATWTEKMKEQFLSGTTKGAYMNLLRVCGYGVPNLEQALHSASNSLTLIAQQELQPYTKRLTGGYKSNDMHFHKLPWPKDVLLSLGETKVTMKIVLSYFIEPGPGQKGWRDKYRYPSHGLRFDMNAPLETHEDFLWRINKAARDEEDDVQEGDSDRDKYWTIGLNGRKKGSLHVDIWTGSAADLASCGAIAIYPVGGWWKERSYLGKATQKCRYSLIASISTERQDIDIYTPVANLIGIATPVEIIATV